MFTSSSQYAASLEEKIRQTQMKITKIKKLRKNPKKIRSATTETISNKIVETELVDDSVTDIELSHESDMSEISLSVEEEISRNDNSNPLQHLYENDET